MFRTTRIRCSFTLLCVAWLANAVCEARAATPERLSHQRFDPTQKSELTLRLVEDLADGRLAEHSLLQAVLIAGGVESDRQLATSQLAFDHLRKKVVAAALGSDRVIAAPLDSNLSGTQLANALALLSQLHRTGILEQFNASASRLDQTLADGRFNCLSSSILFHLLCRDLGLDTCLVQHDDHVYVQLNSAGREFAIETTAPADRQTYAQQIPLVSESTSSASAKRLSDEQLVALVFYNRGAHGIESGNSEAGLAYSLVAWRLDPTLLAARTNALFAAAHLGVPENSSSNAAEPLN